MDESTLKIWTLGIALLGAGLGIYNAVRAWRSDRVRLRVRMRIAFPSIDKPGIEIVNLSTFPVTIVRAGWVEPRSRKWGRRKWVRSTPSDAEAAGAPLTWNSADVGPRKVLVVKFANTESHKSILAHRRVFATTACGTTVLSPVLPSRTMVSRGMSPVEGAKV